METEWIGRWGGDRRGGREDCGLKKKKKGGGSCKKGDRTSHNRGTGEKGLECIWDRKGFNTECVRIGQRGTLKLSTMGGDQKPKHEEVHLARQESRPAYTTLAERVF